MWSKSVRVAALAFIAAAGTLGMGRGEQEFGKDYRYDGVDAATYAKLDELVGKPMPSIDGGTDWANGKGTSAEQKGKVVLVDVWATWCGPCKAAIPHNNELARKYRDDLVVVGVCSADGQEQLGQVMQKIKIEYPVCKDPENKIGTSYNVGFYPTYVAVDRKGIVRGIGLRPDKVEEVLKKLIAEPKP